MIEELNRNFKPSKSPEERPLKMELTEHSREVVVGDERVHLTSKEYQLLWLLNSRDGELLQDDAIWEFIYGDDEKDVPLSNVIETLVGRIKKKLEGANAKVTISREWGLGYRLEKI